MIGEITNLVAYGLMLSGAVFALIGGIGMLRLPDFYSRMHAAGITDTLGAWLVLAGFGVYEGLSLVTVKLLLLVVFIFFTSPVSTHAVANAALTAGLRPVVRRWRGKKKGG